jgi:hypothetical protein
LYESATNEKDKILVILCGFFGLREGESIHFRKDWIHYNDVEAKHYKYPHIEVPDSGTIECNCVDCKKREYIKLKDDGVPHSKEWNSKIQNRFYKLKNQKMKDGESKLDHIFRKHHIIPYWQPKTTEGAGKVGTFDNSVFEPLIAFFQKNESIGLSRFKVWSRISKLGLNGLNKKLFPHAIRASHATILSRKGVNVFSIKTNMRHRGIGTTNEYVNSEAEQSLKDIKDACKEE